MFKVVFDTNVIISALYNPNGRPASLLKSARKGQIRNFISAPILAEVQRILSDKLNWPKTEVSIAINWLQGFSTVVEPKTHLEVISDPPDNRILECALESQADYIVSGDHHLTDLQHFKGIKIIAPSKFEKILERPLTV
ncbi:MAG: putative toxin-antitoxin system toxin component, PIN family [Candidatus Magnetobacterium sp. LHC-1]|uniref:Toxin-antitoxin system toxin component, PIN family n=1 Tax=Candidatus Magnetobacterium casense TaxID=1455061 RepID=A0ABS6S000_9BACT|nr:putative toxin-antitoxin system toxin component, PIN family [Candidatus Magnetobacterium casensis]MBF0608919.1 putative toxin-antitoxin system toxin component, PIN family [Nitrospirota bacterium]MBV6342178.1 putative toxin-antitoxin system toxin component, PIN family [Candidatus Magnetobacterium casensis]